MRIEQFINEECIMANIELEIYSEIFDLQVIDNLSDNEFHRKVAYWLCSYLNGNSRGVFEELSKINIYEQSIVYETWFLILQSHRELKLLAIRIIKYQLELNCRYRNDI